MSRDKRRVANRWGMNAETWAVWSLRFKGYHILARRVRTPAGEIDIVARKGRTVVFVEVKARPDIATALSAVSDRQRTRIARAAAAYLAQHPYLIDADVRFDVIAVTPGRIPHHLQDAWRPNGY